MATLSKTRPADIEPVHPSSRRDRDRFVALAFCWGEFLMELDARGTVVFAAGATEALVGRQPAALIGESFRTLAAAADQPLIDGLLAFAGRRGRIDGASVRLLNDEGQPTPLLVSGYRLEDLDGHIFLAFRQPPKPSRAGAVRDPETGLLTADSFIQSLTDGDSDGESVIADGGRMTFIGAENYGDLRDRITADREREVQAQIGMLLRTSAVNDDAAVALAPGRYGLVHAPELDVGHLERGIGDLLREVDPTGVGAIVQASTIDVDDEVLKNTDVAKGLVYTINRFRTSQGEGFNIEELSNNLSDLTSQAVEAVRAFKATVADARFDVAFQPIVNARTGEIHHYEALARFPDDTASAGPFQQIVFAEETGLIVEFDLVMVRKVIDWLSKTPLNSSIQVAVNISGLSVCTDGFLASLDRLLADNPWTRGRLMFEITESARMERLGMANLFFQRLRECGYAVCLDDFGAGAANFQYLARLEVDIVKLDGQAVRNARRGAKGQAFLRAFVNLCRDLGVRTIAEMIEDESDIRFVRSCGIEFVQGYLFGKASSKISDFKSSIPKHLFAG